VGFKIGELVKLSDFGMLIHGNKRFSVGIVLSEPYDLLTPLGSKETTYYEAYDLLIGDEVIKGIPIQFLYRMTEDEKVEEMAERNKAD
jgi:hypothetical protein